MSYLDLAKSVRTKPGYGPKSLTAGRVQQKQSTAASSCNLLAFPPTAEDLKYSLDYVRRHAPELPPRYRLLYEKWLELFRSAGWPQEEAQRAAFGRAIRLPEKWVSRD